MTIRFPSIILFAFLLPLLAFTNKLQAQSTESNSPAPVELFSINFDLSPETAAKVGKVRFGCEYQFGACKISGTTVFTILTEKGKLNKIIFSCHAYDGCSFSKDEVKTALASQKSLVFDGNCASTSLGARICVSNERSISMTRYKFRVPELNFD